MKYQIFELLRNRSRHDWSSQSAWVFFQALFTQLLKAGVNMNLSEILLSVKRG